MAGYIRLFEKTSDGLLVEVHPGQAEQARAARRHSRVLLPVDVLWTAEEEEARDVEETAAQLAKAARAEADAAAAIRKQVVLKKLANLGLTQEDLDLL